MYFILNNCYGVTINHCERLTFDHIENEKTKVQNLMLISVAVLSKPRGAHGAFNCGVQLTKVIR